MKLHLCLPLALAACATQPPVDNPTPFTASSGGSSGGSTGTVSTGSSGGTSSGSTGSESLTPATLGDFGALGQVYFAASAQGSNLAVIDSYSGSGNHTYQWMHYEPRTGWSTATSLLPAGTPAFLQAALAADDAGDAVFAYIENVSPSQLFVMHYSHAHLAWSAATQPDNYAKGFNNQISLSMNATGNALVLYQHDGSTPNDYDAYVLAYAATGDSWTSNRITSGNTTNAPGGSVKVRLSDGGGAVAMFENAGTYSIASLSATTWTVNGTTIPHPMDFDLAINATSQVVIGIEDFALTYHSYRLNVSSPPDIYDVDTADAVFFPGCHITMSVDSQGDGIMQRCLSTSVSAAPVANLYTLSGNAVKWESASGLPVNGGNWPYSMSVAFDKGGATATTNAVATWLESPSVAAPTATTPRLSLYNLLSWTVSSSVSGTAKVTTAYLTSNDRGWVLWEQGETWLVQKVE